MIRKDGLIMEKKKDFTIEDMRRQCEEAKKNFETLNEQLKKAEQEEEERKRAQLALEQEARKKEVDDAIENVKDLVAAYVEDYGSYTNKYDLDDYGLFPNRRLPWWF
jgi:chromosome segregation ATPase